MSTWVINVAPLSPEKHIKFQLCAYWHLSTSTAMKHCQASTNIISKNSLNSKKVWLSESGAISLSSPFQKVMV